MFKPRRWMLATIVVVYLVVAGGCGRRTKPQQRPQPSPPAIGAWIFVADEANSRIYVIDPETNKLTTTLKVPRPTAMVRCGCGGQLMVISGRHKTVHVIHTRLSEGKHAGIVGGAQPFVRPETATIPAGVTGCIRSPLPPYRGIIACGTTGQIAVAAFHAVKARLVGDGSGGNNNSSITASPEPETIYVSNADPRNPGAPSKVHSIDLKSGEIVATAQIGPAAHGAAYSAATKLAYFACSDGVYAIGTEGHKLGKLIGSVEYPDAVSGARWLEMALATDPSGLYGSLVVSSERGYTHTRYVACLIPGRQNAGLGHFEVIEVGGEADAVAINLHGGRMLVGLANEDRVAVVDVDGESESLNKVVGYIAVGPPVKQQDGSFSRPVAISDDGRVGYVLNGDGTVSACDLADMKETARIRLGGALSAIIAVYRRAHDDAKSALGPRSSTSSKALLPQAARTH